MSLESIIKKRSVKLRRRMKIRGKISGTALRPRLSVSKSLLHIYGQLIDDINGAVLLGIHDKSIQNKENLTKTELAKEAGKALAQKAKEQGITAVVFDRGGNKYHGRVKAFAEGARAEGLIF